MKIIFIGFFFLIQIKVWQQQLTVSRNFSFSVVCSFEHYKTRGFHQSRFKKQLIHYE
jgi:hypothetical protein